MKYVRKIVFWAHLVVGLVVGVGVAVMAGTGLLMAFEHPILERAETYDGRGPDAKADAKSIEYLLQAAMDDVPDARPTALTAYPDLARPAAVQFGREKVLYLNNYTGKAVGTEAAGLRSFFGTVEQVHRWLALGGDYRNWGKAWTGVVNLGFLTLIVSGLWLWVPRKLKWKNFKLVLVPNVRLKGKARDWNWHNVLGFWTLVPLAVIVLTGTVISYTWATNLLYRAVGDTPPPPRNEPNRQANAGSNRGGMRGGLNSGGGQPINTDGLGDLWAAAEKASPGWSQLTLQLGGRRGGGDENNEAARGGVQFVSVVGSPLNPANRTTLTFDRDTGELKSKQAYADLPAGRQARVMIVPVHRGELFGLTGMTIAAGCCVSALVLVYTGFALSYRRLLRPVLARVRKPVDPTLTSVRGETVALSQ